MVYEKENATGLRALGVTNSVGRSSLSDAIHLFGPVEVTSLYFNSQTLSIDGYRFIRCRFDKCTLNVNSLNFEFIECVIDGACTINYGSQVNKVIKLFNSRFDWAREHWPAFVPIVNGNGTITITGGA